jgi:protocatechuate 3,4-dioxygenase beta subunit
MPAGVLHLSLFDANGIGHAERLVFVNKHKQLNISIVTDKQNYLPREKVTAHITVTDEKGRPVKTTLSLSAGDNLLTHTQNTNILSALLLEPDLGRAAHQAGYLFDPANRNADIQMDLLLMTNGWRRFTWKQVYYGTRQPMALAPEKAVIKGKVIDAETGRSIKDVKITNKTLGINTATAADGSFIIPNIDLSQLREINFAYKVGMMTMVVNRYQTDLVVSFKGDGRKVYQPQANSHQHPVLSSTAKPAKGTAIAGQVLNAYGQGIAGASVSIAATDGTTQRLNTDAQGYYLAYTKAGSYRMEVNAPGYKVYNHSGIKTEANQLSMLDVLLQYQVEMGPQTAHYAAHEGETFANRYAFLAGPFDPAYNNPVEETSKSPFANEPRSPMRDGVTAYYIEGMKMRYNQPLMLPISAIGHMQVFDQGLPSKYNDASGKVMDVTTGVSIILTGTPKAPEDRPTGFHVRYAQPREYPKTQYGVREKTDNRTDLRSTLHWNGNISTDANGKATVEFFASDDLAAFRMVVEGVGSNGMPGRKEQLVGMAWPFNLQVIIPSALTKGDKVPVLLYVENFTGKQITGSFDFNFPSGLKPIWPLAPKEHSLFPQRNDTIKVQFEVIDPMAKGTLTIGYTANGYRDVFTFHLPPIAKKED